MLSIDSQETFLVSLDIAPVPLNIVMQYEREEDERGERCLREMAARINSSLVSFEERVNNFNHLKKRLDMYLTDPEFLGKSKRSGAMIFAVMVTMANLFASGANIFMSVAKLQNFENRLDLMSQHIENLESNQHLLQTNIDLLYEKDQFMGLNRNLMVDYMNSISTMHACDMLHVVFESKLVKFDSHLDKILSAIYQGKLDNSLVDLKTLKHVTSQPFFGDTIYKINPSLLYLYSKVEIVSLSNTRLTMMVNYPKITREYVYDQINIIDAQTTNFGTLPSFLVPHNLNLTTINTAMDTLRSTDHCIKHPKFTACPDVPLPPGCVRSFLDDSNVDYCRKTRINLKPFTLNYFRSGALISLMRNSTILDKKTNEILFKPNRSSVALCVFLPKRKDLVLQWPGGKKDLFPSSRINHFVVQPNFRWMSPIKIERPLKNLTLPTFVPTVKKAPPISRNVFVDYTFVIGISCAATIGAMLIVLVLVFVIYFKFCVVDIGRLYGNQN